MREFAFFPVAVMILLALGACGLACRRLVSVIFLVGGGVIALLVLGAIGFTSVRQVHYVEAQQLEVRQQARIELTRQHEAARLLNAEPIPMPDRSQPVEAPRPSKRAEATVSRVEEITPAASESLPDWVRTTMVSHGDQRLVVVNSQQFADPTTAWSEALAAATELVRRNFDDANHHSHESWQLDPETVRSHAVRNSFTEEIRRTAGEHDFTVYRTYLLVELSPDVRRQIEPIWRHQVSGGRSKVVAVLLASLTAIAGLVAGFFRLDDRTSGRYRWPLAFGAMAAAVLLGGVVLTGARHAAGGMRSPDPWPTPHARPVPPHAEPAPPPMALAPQRPLESFVSTTECPN